ncbi:MAG: HAD hydrolase family protein [Thermoguttaceae bacterium]|nr:HAD hydrolase family protein [Thermoguttaceae bacterium]
MVVSGKRLEAIRLVLCSVDGVLTDGRLLVRPDSSEIMCFHSHDLLGIKLWQKAGGQFGVVSSRSSQLIRNLAEEVGVSIVRQGMKDKLAACEKIIASLGLTMEETCFLGDDLPDLRVIQTAGLGVAVASASAEVRDAADMTLSTAGGCGALRELIERLLKSQNLWNIAIQEFAGQI